MPTQAQPSGTESEVRASIQALRLDAAIVLIECCLKAACANGRLFCRLVLDVFPRLSRFLRSRYSPFSAL
jgi:hypothetical protein